MSDEQWISARRGRMCFGRSSTRGSSCSGIDLMRNSLLFNLLLVGFAAGCGRSDPLVLGHIDPKNDDDAEYRALDLAVQQTNADPAKQPFERRVKIVHGMAGKKPEEIEGQAVRLAAVDRVFALLGGHRSSIAEIIGKAAQE